MLDKLELLKRIRETNEFLEFTNPDLIVVLEALAAEKNIRTLAFCLHMAYEGGQRVANERLAKKARERAEWHEGVQAFALDCNRSWDKE
jgi:hypothetical protein